MPIPPHMFRSLLFIICSIIALTSTAQLEQRYTARLSEQPQWVQLMMAADPDPGAVRAAYDAYYTTHPFVKSNYTQYYKRWFREIGHTLVPRDPVERAAYEQNLQDYLASTAQITEERSGGTWQCIGPFDWDHSAVDRSYAPGAAHVYTMEEATSDANTLYAGTANAGLWKTTDKASTWTNMTKGMIIDQILSVEIDPTNPNIVYFGANGKLWKSIDGGTTNNIIGDATFNSVTHDEIRDLVLQPGNNQRLFVCSSQGLYRTDNGGTSFTQVMTGIWQELEVKPGDPNTIYAVKQTGIATQFWRSTNGGTSFTQMTTGWPVPVAPDEQKRTEIAVTAANPAIVYALCTGAASGGTGLYGIYKSTDNGASWTFQCCGTGPGGAPSPTNFNLMGWDDGGQDDGGQYYYDLSLTVSPADANKVRVCGVNHWVSTDGGVTFSCPSKWSHSYKVNYVHADIHDIRYYGTELWVACDGGIFYSADDGVTFTRKLNGIAGTDFWGFGMGQWSGGQVMLGGAYHNGTMLKDNSVYTNGWICTDGGDGYRGFVHPQFDRRALSDYGYKTLSGDRTVSNANTGWAKQPNASYTTGESSEIVWHPNLYNTAYVGADTALYITTDNGASFSKVHDFHESVTSVEVGVNDPNTIYVSTFTDWWSDKHIYRSTDAGVNWTNITPSSATLNGNTWVPYDLAVSGTDAQTLWMVRTSMYGNYPSMNGYITYKSVNGGTTWTNTTSASLNGEWPTGIAHQLGSNNALYIGTRRSVYTLNDALASWTLYNNGLPAETFSTKLLINYRLGLVRNGTNRSVWEAPVYDPSVPLANISADRRNVDCLNPAVQFLDASALSGTGAAWSWNFPGGSPSTSIIRNPLITYNAAGNYNVSLTVTDVNGTSTKTWTNFITYANSTATLPFSADAENGVVAPTGWTLQNPDNLGTWGNVSLAMGANCAATKAWRMDYYGYNAPGQEDRLLTPVIDLAGSAGTHLRFHHAYAPYGASYPDGLRVEISANCGANWTQLYYATGTALGTAPQTTSNWLPTACNQWLLHDIDLSAYDGQNVIVRFTGINAFGNELYLDNITLVNNGVKLALKVFLEGAYDQVSGLMRDDMRAAAILPATEPYTALGFTQASDGGGEVMQSGVTSTTGNNAIVDWVMVELHNSGNASSIVATRPALVQRDGDVVDVDGVSPIAMLASVGNYFVAVRHRNHSGCMANAVSALSGTTTAIDFTNTSLALYGTAAQKIVGTVNTLWMGNTVKDGYLKYTGATNDRDPILVRIGGVIPTATVNGYYVEDCTLDGTVKYTGASNDRDPILVNIGGTIPTNVRVEQLP